MRAPAISLNVSTSSSGERRGRHILEEKSRMNDHAKRPVFRPKLKRTNLHSWPNQRSLSAPHHHLALTKPLQRAVEDDPVDREDYSDGGLLLSRAFWLGGIASLTIWAFIYAVAARATS